MPRKKQAISTAPNQPYGEAQKQERAQQVAPLAGQPDPMEAAAGFTPNVQPLSAEGDPSEPLTAGLPIGEGPGPEALPRMPQFQSENNVDAKLSAHLLPMLQAMASQKQLSPSTVRFMKALRTSLPMDYSFQETFERNRQ